MTEWQARRAGRRILCGRQVAGRFVCQGEVARINRHHEAAEDWSPEDPGPDEGPEVVFLMPGMTEDPAGSGFWRPSARAHRIVSRGQRITVKTTLQMGQREASLMRTPRSAAAFVPMQLPFRRPCPDCGVVVVVPAGVLGS